MGAGYPGMANGFGVGTSTQATLGPCYGIGQYGAGGAGQNPGGGAYGGMGAGYPGMTNGFGQPAGGVNVGAGATPVPMP
jgi:hypothetical protein